MARTATAAKPSCFIEGLFLAAMNIANLAGLIGTPAVLERHSSVTYPFRLTSLDPGYFRAGNSANLLCFHLALHAFGWRRAALVLEYSVRRSIAAISLKMRSQPRGIA